MKRKLFLVSILFCSSLYADLGFLIFVALSGFIVGAEVRKACIYQVKLWHYAKKGDIEEMRACRLKGYDINGDFIPSEFRPLIGAVENNQLEAVCYLIRHGANINVRDDKTPLIAAIHSKNANMVRLLLRKGADIYQKDGRCRSALTEAQRSGEAEILRMLKRKEALIGRRLGERLLARVGCSEQSNYPKFPPEIRLKILDYAYPQ